MLDIKPYIPYCDTPFDAVRQASWLSAPPREPLRVVFSAEATQGLATAASAGLRHIRSAEDAMKVIEAVMANGKHMCPGGLGGH